MKRILFMLVPIVIAVLAFRPFSSYHTITGKIKDSNGKAIVAATVAVKGTSVSTQTGKDGSYQINAENKLTGILIVSAPGFETKEVSIGGKTVVDVVLKTKADLSKTTTEKELKGKVAGAQNKSEVLYRRNIATAPSKSFGYTTGNGYISTYDEPRIANRNGYYADSVVLFNTEDYDHIKENPFLKVTDNPLSTFSIDVDAASYSNVRRFLNNGALPPAGAVRIEEMINYFHYEYPQPTSDKPFSINTEISDAPWNKNHKLVLIGLQGKRIPTQDLPASNLVFLIDVSGSMNMDNKLPLVKASMKMLVDQLRDQDRVAIVVYAGAAGLVLPPTSGEDKTKIKDAIDNLEAGGSTAGGAGIKLAYKTAKEHFVKEGNNRVILCTDGDFNVGESSDDAMERMIEQERKSGVFLTVLGYGMGNYKDNKMQKLADKGNGNHSYIDGINEAKKVLVNEFGGTLFTIAKDVKLQIEFNPAKVQGYRLIGYENRMLAKEDFNDDKKDAGELGSGHTVTALYEVIPAGVNDEFLKKVDDLKYQDNKKEITATANTDEILTVKFRYKAPDGDVSKLIEHAVIDRQTAITKTSENFRFAASVAEFGMLLRDSEFKSGASYSNVIKMAKSARGVDEEGYRIEFIRLVESAKLLAKETKEVDEDEVAGVVPAKR
jgi:Ca-activated chloride channel family protein